MGLKLSPKILAAALFATQLACASAHASDWRIGATLGLGGAGIDSAAQIDDGQGDGGQLTVPVSRNEGPGVASIFVDRLLSDRYTLGFEHIRGFRFGPASSGVSFTGVMWRWYWSGLAPSVISAGDGGSILLVQRFTPFVGLMGGIAQGTVDRQSDLVPQVNGSGVYMGLKLGADYPLSPGITLRPEISTAGTFLSQGATQTTLKLFALQCGIMFNL